MAEKRTYRKGTPTPKKRAKKIIDRVGRSKIDRTARKIVEHFAEIPSQKITTGSLQSSFHEAERKAAGGTYRPQFPIVGVGASAGGIESFNELISHVPADTGMAFVLIQHLAPHHDSLLPSIVARATKMQVHLGENDLEVKPDNVYIIPPNTSMGIVHGKLKILPRIESPGRHLPVDFFFRCLSEDQRYLAIGIILSGADGDGAQGLKSIRAQGGLTFAQDPKTAKVNGMPRSAIAAGATDTVLNVFEIASELTRVSRHPLVQIADGEFAGAASELSRIFTILKNETGVDFSKYKLGTVKRRLRRRILIHRVATLQEYVDILINDRDEVDALYNDMLISVTSFFRDPEVFDLVKEKLIPRLLKRSNSKEPLRIWVPGCATGEEAYSLGILLAEAMEKARIFAPVQIFASDISERALSKAREAIYPDSIAVDVSHERLRKYFVKSSGGYRIAPAIREMCIFARHDLIRDPPFSRMHLISCRNLLIYIGSEQQKRVIDVFGYALVPRGYLMLGTSETSGSAKSFDLVSKQARVYVRKAAVAPLRVELQAGPSMPFMVPPRKVPLVTSHSAIEFERELNRILLERYAPAGVVIDSHMQIQQFRGATGDFLEASSGEPNLNLFKMARSGLDTELRVIVKRAEKSGKVQSREVSFLSGGRRRTVILEVVPVRIFEDAPSYLVLFNDLAQRMAGLEKIQRGLDRRGAGRGEANRIREELEATKEHLQSIIREQDLTNEELQAANEEVLSSNEELQSTNEELETAKEELQSANEELSTVNDELTDRNSLLVQANNDLNNLLSSVSLPIVMVGNDLRIRRYTPMVERLLNIIPSDIGRPITDIKPNIEVPDLEALITNSIDSMQTTEREVQDRSGHWYSLRIRPYRTEDHKLDGAVLLLVDIGAVRKRHELREVNGAESDAMVEAIDQPVLFLDQRLRVVRVNHSYLRIFQMKLEELVDFNFFEIGDGAWAQPMLKALVHNIIPKNAHVTDYKVDLEFPRVGAKSFLVNARKVQRGGAVGIMMILDDVTPL